MLFPQRLLVQLLWQPNLRGVAVQGVLPPSPEFQIPLDVNNIRTSKTLDAKNLRRLIFFFLPALISGPKRQ